MPDERDAQALAALVLLHDSRRATRVDAGGALVPLDEQDRGRWDRGRIVRGLDRLQWAAGATGPDLPQAVIAALHATAPTWQQTDWATICHAYDRLIEIADSPVARANRALAIGFRDGFTVGLAALDEVADDPRLARSNTVAAIRADLLRRAGRGDEALEWYRIALDRDGSEPGTRVSAPPRRRVRRTPLMGRRVYVERNPCRWLACVVALADNEAPLFAGLATTVLPSARGPSHPPWLMRRY